MSKMKSRDSNHWLRDHVSHNKFCFDKQFTAEHFKMSCSPKSHKALFYEGLTVSVRCEGIALARSKRTLHE